MNISGILKLCDDNDDFIIPYKGRVINISEILDLQRLEKLKVVIKHRYSRKTLFDSSGELIEKKISPMYYSWHVGGQDLGSVLWNNVGELIDVTVENISKY